MKITSENIQITPKEIISWADVETLRLLNDRLDVILESGKIVEFAQMHPFLIDKAFRSYEQYLREHPEKRKSH